MGINRNFNSKFIQVPGEYRAKITESKVETSKSGKQMLVVTLETEQQETIKHYFVKGQEAHVEHLARLKKAAGLADSEHVQALVGKSVGIAVDAGQPTPDGKVFMRVVGVGLASDVAGHSGFTEDQVPF